MKKGILICLVVAGLGMPGVLAQDYGRGGYSTPQSHYAPVRQGNLHSRVSQLNRTLSQVRYHAKARGAGWQVRTRIANVSSDVNRINLKFRRGNYNPHLLSREIASAQSRLYVIQRMLRNTHPGPHYYSAR